MAELFYVGQRLNEWTIRQKFDGAGQTDIYLADRKDFHGNTIKAAIRTIKFEENQNQQEKTRIKRAYALEYDALQKFNSDFIAKAYDYGLEPDFWIATELIEGVSLANRLNSNRPDKGVISEQEWLLIAKDAIRGLMHAHERKIVHQDIKPGNFMIREVDGRGIWIDFGSASIIGKQDKGYNGEGYTLPFLAPERILHLAPGTIPGSSRGDSRSDMFSVGVMLYVAATGKLPWVIPSNAISDDKKNQAMVDAILNGSYDLNVVRPKHRKLISSLLNPNPSQRATAVQALKLLGAADEEIHGGTVRYGGDLRNVAGSPRATRTSSNPQFPSRNVSGINSTPKPIPVRSKPEEKPGNLKVLSLILVIVPIGLFHPIVTWIWYAQYRTKEYLKLAVIGTSLSALYFIAGFSLPRTSSGEIAGGLSFPFSLISLSVWLVAFAAHSRRPRKQLKS